MSSKVIRKMPDGSELCVADCYYGDDAEALFKNYVKDNLSVKVVFSGVFGEEVTHNFDPEAPL